MGTYRLHRGWREPNGLITNHAASAHTITAATAYDAVAAALADGKFLLDGNVNLAWLTDELGTMVWSLRLDDDEAMPMP